MRTKRSEIPRLGNDASVARKGGMARLILMKGRIRSGSDAGPPSQETGPSTGGFRMGFVEFGSP